MAEVHSIQAARGERRGAFSAGVAAKLAGSY